MSLDNVIICRCEEVTLGTLMAVAEQHRCSPRELKLRTRAGMGYCGGRTCRSLIDMVIQQTTGRAATDNVTLKHQPPVRPMSFQQLGGQRHG